MSDINGVRERLAHSNTSIIAGSAGVVEYSTVRTDDLRALLADHARLQEIVNASVIYSNSDGDYLVHDPAAAEFVDGLAVGDEYELLVGLAAVTRKFRVTKAPDASSDDYEVEEVQP